MTVASLLGRAGLVAVALALATRAGAWDVHPARTGGSGILDVPDSEVILGGAAKLSAHFGAERDAASTSRAVPLPVAGLVGLGSSAEFGFGLRQGGGPGDPVPSPALFSVSWKRRLREAKGASPGLALQLRGDRVNAGAWWGARAVASTVDAGRLRLAAFAGLDLTADRSLAPGIGAAGVVALNGRFSVAGQALWSGGGGGVGAALRWKVAPNVGGTAGLDLTDSALRFSVGFAVATPLPKRMRPKSAQDEAAPLEPQTPQFLDDAPRFRMRITPGDGSQGDHEHYEQPPPTGTTLRAARTARAPEAEPERARRRGREAIR